MRWSVPIRYVALSALLLAVAGGPAAQSWRDTGFQIARINSSAHSAAIAGAGALTGDDPTALFYNPAALKAEMDGGISIGYLNHISDVSAGTALYVIDVPKHRATVAGSIRYLSYGSFDRTDNAGASSGTFSASETVVSLTASRQFSPRVRGGATVHALFAGIDDASSQAIAADMGATYEIPSQQLTLGASVRNAGRVFSSLGSIDDRLPLDIRVTVSKRLRYVPLTVTVSGTDLQHFDGADVDSSVVRRAFDHVLAGGELQLGSSLAVRGGYAPRIGRDLRSGSRLDLAGVSLGFGIKLRRIALDYAYNGWSEYGGLHQFGVRTKL